MKYFYTAIISIFIYLITVVLFHYRLEYYQLLISDD